VQAALDEFSRLGRTAFLLRYGFGKPRDFMVKNPANGELVIPKPWSVRPMAFSLLTRAP
jgi:hypothetical protein